MSQPFALSGVEGIVGFDCLPGICRLSVLQSMSRSIPLLAVLQPFINGSANLWIGGGCDVFSWRFVVLF
jgi:hypothetical protein